MHIPFVSVVKLKFLAHFLVDHPAHPVVSCIIIITIICSLPRVFHASVSWWFSYWSLSGSKSPQISRTLLSILADLNNAVVWIVSTRPVISKSSSPRTNPLMTVPRAPFTSCIIVTFMFPSFFNSLENNNNNYYYYYYGFFNIAIYYYYYNYLLLRSFSHQC